MKAIVLAVGFAVAGSASAMKLAFDNDEMSGSFDTTISAGVSVRTQAQDLSLIGIANGGTSRSVNEDDGNRLYDKNKTFSELLKVNHELELKYGTWGVFLRGMYFVDFAARRNYDLGPIARDRLAEDAEMLDAFVTKSFDVNGKNLRFRAGKQVISWGESTFIPNSINVINPVDVSKLRTPGSELKEAFIPTISLSGSYELSKAASMEAFVLFNHDKFRLDPRGAYFSSNDYALDDGNQVFVGFGRRKDLTGKTATNPVPPTTPGAGPVAAALYGPFDPAAAVWAPRGADRPASDYGQYGLAFRYLATELNNSEFGLYFLNYHSRIPMLSGIKGTVTSVLTGGPLATPVGHTGTASYFAEYPEDIRLYGVSFNTAGPAGIALQGEFSYRPNQPLAYSGIELILAALGQANTVTGGTQIPGAPAGATEAFFVPNGTYLQGYARVKMSQFQMTATKTAPQVLGADQGALVGEIGYTHYSGLPNAHNLPFTQKFNAPGVFLPALALAATTSDSRSIQTDGYVTTNSWGYRLVGRLDYSNLVFGANVSPRLAFSHDVSGVSQTFNEGVMSYALGANFEWQKKWTLDLSYTSYFGGRTYCGTDSPATVQTLLGGQAQTYCSSANPIKDRDFYSIVATYSF
jgi:hypothetical protein